jgi:hypothetical protein
MLIETNGTLGETTMTTDLTTEYSLAELAQILSAIDGQHRSPCSKKAAIKAINKKAEALGIDPDEVFDAAAALLGGKDPEEWANDLTAAKDQRLAQEVETIEQIRAKQDRVLATIARLDAEDAAKTDAEDEPAEAQIETSWNHRMSPAALGEEALRAEDEARAKQAEPEAQEPVAPALDDEPRPAPAG